MSSKITNDKVFPGRTELKEMSAVCTNMPRVLSQTNWSYPEGFLIIKRSLHCFPINDPKLGAINETYAMQQEVSPRLWSWQE